MKFDYTPFIHGAIAVACQLIAWVVFANPWIGAFFAIVWWCGREHAQAEARWRATLGKDCKGVAWTGGFNPKVWKMGDVLDVVLPVIACTITYFVIV